MSNRHDGRAPYATFSLIFGLLCVPCFTLPLPAPLAVIFGHIALGHFGNRPADDFGRGRAWMGLFLGYLSLAVFGVLAILMAIGLAVEPEEVVSTPEEVAVPADPIEAPPLPTAAQGPAQDDDVFLVDGDPRYHTFFCRLTSDAQAQRTRFNAAVGAGFRPCDVCQPTPR